MLPWSQRASRFCPPPPAQPGGKASSFILCGAPPMAVMARKAVLMEIIVKTLGGSIRLRFDFPLDPSNALSLRLWLLQRIAIRPAPLTAVLAAGRTGCQRDDRVRVQGCDARKDGSAASHLQGLRRCEIFSCCCCLAAAAAVTLLSPCVIFCAHILWFANPTSSPSGSGKST